MRAWLSASLYRSPVFFPTALLVIGVLGAMLVMTSGRHDPVVPSINHFVSSDRGVNKALEYRANKQEEQLRALSIQLSNLQARATRLDALGQEWVDEAGLDDAGFNFGEPPPSGGPDDLSEPFGSISIPMLSKDTIELAKQYDQLEAQLQILDSYADLDRRFPASQPHASPGGRYLTSGFGARYDPFGRGRRFHSGLDLAAHVGDPVMAMAAGRVSFSGWQDGYGYIVEVDHGNGYRTKYAHNSKLIVRVGQRVEVGQVLAKAGSTGRSTGAHLHVEVWHKGRAVDPRPFLDQGRRLLAERRKVLAQLALVPQDAPIQTSKSKG